MPTLSAPDLAALRSGQPHIRRWLSAAPRASVYTATVSAVLTDSDTGGIHAITFSGGSGSLTDALPGFTLDIGTTAGARDVGALRLRKAPIAGTFYVGETAPGAVHVQPGHHLTVRRERRPWRVLPRIVGTDSGVGYPDSFTHYADYDLAYAAHNSAIQPQANIAADAAGNPVRPAGWTDAGQTYRTLALYAGGSLALAAGASIASYAWNVGDGTITVGTAASVGITVQFPAASVFRYVALTVTDTNGTTHTRHLPIWVHSAAHPPLSAFEIVRDARTAAGRALTLDLFGADDSLSAAAFPAGTTLCCWEESAFGAAAAAPASVVGAALGWALEDAETLRVGGRSRLRVEIGGVGAWLDRFAASPQTLRDTGAAPAAWDELAPLTADRAAHYALRRWSGALDLANFYPSGAGDRAESLTLDGATVWEQAANAAASGCCGVLGCDSLGNLWLRRDFNHLDAADRAARPTVLTLTAADWTDADGLEIDGQPAERVGIVEGTGIAWDGASAPIRAASIAPGRVGGSGSGRARLPAQILPPETAQEALNALTGHRRAALNNPRPAIRLTLVHPLDCLEPAWNEPVALTWANGSLRSTTLTALKCLVTRIEVEHSSAPDQPPKRIAWTLAAETSGAPGADAPIRATPTTERPPRPLPPPRRPRRPGRLDPVGQKIAVFGTDNKRYVTTHFQAARPTWTAVTLSSLPNWGGGTLVDFAVDAYSPLYLGTGTTVDGWILSSTHVQRITDIFGTPALGTAHALIFSTPAPTTSACLGFERGVQNWGIVAQHYNGPGGGLAVAHTTDGATWTNVLVNNHYEGNYFNNGNNWTPGLQLSPHIPGRAYTSAMLTAGGLGGGGFTGLVTTNYGASWSPLSAATCKIDGTLFNAGALVVPYQDTTMTTAYYGRKLITGAAVTGLLMRARGGTAVDVSPVYAGKAYGIGWGIGIHNRQVAIADSDRNTALLCGFHRTSTAVSTYGVFLSRDGGDSWTELIAPSTSVPYRAAYIAGSDASAFYLLGVNGAVAQSTDGRRFANKKGNLSTTATLVGLCGG
jgi:hypothetical protein